MRRAQGEGSFVLAMAEGPFDGKPTAYYDLYRLESGKIEEHWKRSRPRAESKNHKGKF